MTVIYHYQAYHYKETCWNFNQNTTSCIQENAHPVSKILIVLFSLGCVQLGIKTLSRVWVLTNEQLRTTVWKLHMLVNCTAAQKIHSCIKHITKIILNVIIHFCKHTMDLLWEKFQWILPLYMKPISFQSKASVVCSVTAAISIGFCLKKLNVFSQHIG